MKRELTYRLINKLKPTGKDYEIRDTKLPGLVLRVRPSGKMFYSLVYARGKRMTIGPAAQIDHAQAREIAKRVLAEHYDGEDPIANRKKIQVDSYLQFLDETYKLWLDQRPHSHPKVAYDTLKKAFHELHKLKLNEITPGLIEKWRVRRRQEGVSESTINRQLSDLRACLNRAKDIWGLMENNPLDKIKSGKIDKRAKVRYLTKEEEAALRKALDEREEDIRASRDSGNKWREKRNYKPFSDLRKLTFVDHVKPAILLSLHTGLRRGELLKLRWENIHFEQRNLTVVAETAKTGETRHIPLNKEALSVLKGWKAQPGLKSPYVFSDSTGQPLREMRTSWEGLLVRAKITNFRWHDLRHTFASKLVMLGENLNTVRELLGHSDYKMTLRYAHLAPKVKQDAVDKLVWTERIK